MYTHIAAALAVFTLAGTVCAEIKTEEISYGDEPDLKLKGYIAYDDSITTKRPGVLVVHEWWGHNAYARKRARMLAELGYTALAVDMYGNGKQADHPETAGKFAGEVAKNAPLAKARFEAAMKLLQAQATTDDEKTAAIGYCFGGGVVLHMARAGLDLDAVISFHGSLGTDTPAAKDAVKARVLVCHGADDPFVPQEAIDAFKKEMADAGATMQFKAYEGAVHSFTNPDADMFGEKFKLPLKYSPSADEASWKDMQALLTEVFSD